MRVCRIKLKADDGFWLKTCRVRRILLAQHFDHARQSKLQNVDAGLHVPHSRTTTIAENGACKFAVRSGRTGNPRCGSAFAGIHHYFRLLASRSTTLHTAFCRGTLLRQRLRPAENHQCICYPAYVVKTKGRCPQSCHRLTHRKHFTSRRNRIQNGI